jgi:hypothetical protein
MAAKELLADKTADMRQRLKEKTDVSLMKRMNVVHVGVGVEEGEVGEEKRGGEGDWLREDEVEKEGVHHEGGGRSRGASRIGGGAEIGYGDDREGEEEGKGNGESQASDTADTDDGYGDISGRGREGTGGTCAVGDADRGRGGVDHDNSREQKESMGREMDGDRDGAAARPGAESNSNRNTNRNIDRNLSALIHLPAERIEEVSYRAQARENIEQ